MRCRCIYLGCSGRVGMGPCCQWPISETSKWCRFGRPMTRLGGVGGVSGRGAKAFGPALHPPIVLRFAAVHESGNGTSTTSRGDRAVSAYEVKAVVRRISKSAARVPASLRKAMVDHLMRHATS